MKRKLEVSTIGNSCEKVVKMNHTEIEKMDITDVNSVAGSRTFNFKLTDKKAKKNLLKSAQRKYLETESKQNCKNLKFSPGSYLLVAKKMVDECQVKFNENVVFNYEDMEIKVIGFHSGHELNNKHFDTKIIFSVNNQKVIMHCYNSTQNLKIDGQAHCYFSENFLEPLLKSKIDDIKEEIDRYDRKLVASLDSSNIGGPLKGISVRKIRNSIDKNLFTCKTCQLTKNNRANKMSVKCVINYQFFQIKIIEANNISSSVYLVPLFSAYIQLPH